MNVRMLMGITNRLFPTANAYFSIVVFICFVGISLFLFYLSRYDLLHHSLTKTQRNLVLVLLPVAGFCGYALYGASLDLFLSFFILAGYYYGVSLYCSCQNPPKRAFGGCDILVAPLFTIWFGTGVIVFLIIYLVLYCIACIPPIREFICSFNLEGEESKGLPLFPILFITYVLSFLIYFSC